MNRDNVLERHLLSRSYDSQSKITELLESRYSFTGVQRNNLVLTPTTGVEPEPKPTEGITNDLIPTKRKANVRTDLRAYIKTTLANQKKVVKKIQAYNRGGSHKHPFPIQKLINNYKVPEFGDFEVVHQLWLKYMENVLFDKNANQSNLLQRLLTADYNGCHLTVQQSKNRHLVGISGIVVWDTHHLFIICVPRLEPPASPAEQVGGLKIVSKKGSLFAFSVTPPGGDKLDFTIVGSRFEVRAVDRTNKKFKSHHVGDII